MAIVAIALVLFYLAVSSPPSAEEECIRAIRGRLVPEPIGSEYVDVPAMGVDEQSATHARIIGRAVLTDALGSQHGFRFDCFLSIRDKGWGVDSIWGP